MTKEGHRDTRVHIERGQERAADTAGVVERNAADAVPGTPNVEGPVDATRLDRMTCTCGEHERVFLAADARIWPVGEGQARGQAR
jgi:hypothetical protein